MKYALLVCVLALAGCASHIYRPKSMAEARAFTDAMVRNGVIAASERESELRRLGGGKIENGEWSQKKIDKWITGWLNQNPQQAKVNIAANNGSISEAERLQIIAQLEMAGATHRAANAAILSTLSRPAPSPSYSPPQTVNLRPTYNGGYTGTIY